jgi:hypothetical protein
MVMTKTAFGNMLLTKRAIIDDAVTLENFNNFSALLPSMPESLKTLLLDLKDYAQKQNTNELWRIRGIMDLLVSLYVHLPHDEPSHQNKKTLNHAYFTLYCMLNTPSIVAKLEEWELKNDLTDVRDILGSNIKPRKTTAKKQLHHDASATMCNTRLYN